VSGPRDDAAKAIESVRQRVMDAVAARYLNPLANLLTREVKPPRFEAQKEYLAGSDLYASDPRQAVVHYKRAIELDPGFASPRLGLWYAYYGHDNAAAARALDDVMNMPQRPTPVMRRFVDECRANLAGRLDEMYSAARDIAKMEPENVADAFDQGIWAAQSNRPRESVESLRKPLQWDLAVKPGNPFGVLSFLFITGSLHLLGQHDEELVEARRASAVYPDLLNGRAFEARALVALGRFDDVDKLVDSVVAMRPHWFFVPCCVGHATPGFVMLCAAEELRAHDHRDASLKMAGRAVDWYHGRVGDEARQEDTRSGLGEALYRAERWEDAKAVFMALAAAHPDSLFYKARLGMLAARLGNRAEAERIVSELRALDSRFLFGNHTYRAACIVALLGDKDRAVALLREAVAQGSGSEDEPESYGYGFIYRHSMDLESLRGYPPFEELIKPKYSVSELR